MRRLALFLPLLLLCLTLSLSALPPVSSAQAPAGAAPEFRLGFKALAEGIPAVVGHPLENERHGPNGDSLQRTSTGLMAWRKVDNWTAFTNGSRSWINGPFGVQERGNDDRFPWEFDDRAQPPGGALHQAASRPVTPVASWGFSPSFGVVEAFRHEAARYLGIGWERLVFSWSHIQPNGPGDWRADLYFPPHMLQRELDRGREVVGLLQFTPSWAARDSGSGERSVPRNLTAPAESPDNHWARFAGRMAAHYRGRIDRWILWNEPEFKPGDRGAGEAVTWHGSDEDYYLLLKRGYQAIKAANPGATVLFAATSYWVDVNMGRRPFFERILDIALHDPEAPANGFFFDAVAFNLYWSPDCLFRIGTETRAAMRARGIDKPIWLTETNAMPHDDPTRPSGSADHRVTMAQQADFAIQALAMASAAGYQRAGWYRMTDDHQDLWGLVREDGTLRPAFHAFGTAVGLFSGARRVVFLPLERPDEPFGTPWPYNPASYYPNWQIYQVVFDHPDGRRVTTLWNGTGTPLRARIPRQGSAALLVDGTGSQRELGDVGGWYLVDLPPAQVRGRLDPNGYHYIGGAPFIIVEQGVPEDAPIQEPRLGDPGSLKPGLELALDPIAQKLLPGQKTSFTLRVLGIEGFDSRLQLSLSNVPQGVRIEMATTAYPGDRVPIGIYTEPGLRPGVHLLPLTASGGGLSATVNVALEIPMR